ncbi:hypothetical protein [Sphingomonas sp.]|uniref:hypothetical protein n=1 Tax=Sphingomonas sp. TaxID=28214 RepID=UPI003F706090
MIIDALKGAAVFAHQRPRERLTVVRQRPNRTPATITNSRLRAAFLRLAQIDRRTAVVPSAALRQVGSMSLPVSRRGLLIGSASLLAMPASARRTKDVPYVPTPPEVVEGMLDMAELKAGERLIDLGSGDGRIPRAAARRGATALGVEIDSDLVARARSLTRLEGLEERARFVRDDCSPCRCAMSMSSRCTCCRR